jgi:two-component system, cell cycle sensor histidine kinase and response regulator CckA
LTGSGNAVPIKTRKEDMVAGTDKQEERRLLIVDDEKDFVLSLTDVLESYGYIVEKAHSGKSAIEKIKEFDAHVALLDIRLGNENGINLISKLKEQAPKLLPLIMTAYATADTAIAALQEGAYDYMRKPLSPIDLLAKLDRCFDRLRLEREKATAEEHYRLLIDTMNDGLGIQDLEGCFTYANNKLCEMTGFDRGELIGRSLTDFMDEINKKRYSENSAKSESEGFKHCELDLLKKDGKSFPAIISPQALKDPEGRIKGYFTVIVDISKHKQDEAARIKIESQLQQAQKMESIGTLAGGISHDFNNSLQAILGYTQMLLIETENMDSIHSRLLQIEKAAKRAGELTQQLLAFSRKVESRLRPIDLNQEVKQIGSLLQRTILKMINIKLNLGENLKVINADPTQVEQILMNLAVNSRDAMGEEGNIIIKTENIKVDQEYCRNHFGLIPGGYVLLTFSDTGQGMDQDTLARIFEPFFTTKEPGKGTGLGLPMVYGLVKKHNGHIECNSKPGSGTTFSIFFPAITEEAIEEVSDKEEIKPIPGGKESILIIDDETLVRELAEHMLTNFGYAVLTAPGGESGLRIYRDKKDVISLVILDMIMPGMGGMRCLQELLKIKPDAKVIIASGYAADGARQNVIESGARGFINKPFNVREMLTAIREALDA